MGRITYEKACRECGTTFTAKRIDARFCGGTCHHAFYRRENIEKIRETRRIRDRNRRAAIREAARTRWAKDSEQLKAQQRKRYAMDSEDPERLAARQARKRLEYQDNREKILARSRDRRAVNGAYRKLSAHGVDWDTLYAELWESQGGKCYLCGDPLRKDLPKAIHLDHDHSCCPLGKSCERCRRGLACKNCNLMVGFAKDDPDRLRRMAIALENANALVVQRMQSPRRTRRGTSWELTCLVCGNDFMAFRSDAMYCSDLCANYASEDRRGLKGPRAAFPVLAPTCAECGDAFTSERSNALYCSRPCSRKAERARAAMRRLAA
jgi:hypothetical protein